MKGISEYEQLQKAQVGTKGKHLQKASSHKGQEPDTPIGNNLLCGQHWFYTKIGMYSLKNVNIYTDSFCGALVPSDTVE